MAPRRLLVDVTQYAAWQARSGVPRVLLHLAASWPAERLDSQFGFLEGSRYVTGPFRVLEFVIRAAFATRYEVTSADVRHALRTAASGTVATAEIEHRFDACLLPEPTFRAKSLNVFLELKESGRTPAFALYYDAIPLTHAKFFPPSVDGEGSVTRYHRALATVDEIAFISAATRRMFETRIARRTLEHGQVVTLGADGLGVRGGGEPIPGLFTVLGTVEPRKRYDVVLDAFESLWRAGGHWHLCIFGAAGPGRPTIFDRIRRLERRGLVHWSADAGDAEVASVIRRSLAVIFIPAVEGAGLPALEALSLGCPLIAAADVPALSDLAAAGQIRLGTVTPRSVARAVETLADSATNDSYRAAIADRELSTWRSFASRVEKWIARRIEDR